MTFDLVGIGGILDLHPVGIFGAEGNDGVEAWKNVRGNRFLRFYNGIGQDRVSVADLDLVFWVVR